MAVAEFGTSSKENQALQKTINELRRQSVVPTDGSFDERTRAALMDLQRDLGVSPTGVFDGATQKAIADARANKRCQVTINGKTAWVTKEEYAKLRARAIAAAVASLQPFVSKAAEARMYWDAHESVRKDHAICHLVDLYTGASFPAEGVIAAAEKAAKSMVADAKAGKSFDVGARAAPIEAALKAMSAYRKATFDGGEDMIKDLEMVKKGSLLTLAILGGLATGGATWQVYVGVNAGIGAVNGLVSEIDKASAKNADLSIGSLTLGVLKGATVEAVVAMVLKGGGKGMGNVLDDAVKKAVANMAKTSFAPLVKEYALRAANGALQELAKTLIRLLGDVLDPRVKLKKEDIIEKLIIAVTLGAALKALGPALEKYGENTAKQYKPGDLEFLFKGLGKIDYKKAFAEEGKKILEAVGKETCKNTLKSLDPKDVPGLEKKLHGEILKSPQLAAWARQAAKNPKYKLDGK